MSGLIRWHPSRDVESMRGAINRLFDEALDWPRFEGMGGMPSIDVMENDENFTVKAEMPGFKPEDVDVRIEGSTLTLRGQMHQENEKSESQYHLRERRMSSFARSISLPSYVRADEAQAEFEDGVLTLTLPKAEEARPKRINVTVKK